MLRRGKHVFGASSERIECFTVDMSVNLNMYFSVGLDIYTVKPEDTTSRLHKYCNKTHMVKYK